MDLHDSLKLVKHGYSKVTDHTSREIRRDRLSREASLALVRRYEEAPLQHLDKFCEWLALDRRGLQFIIDQHRNSRFCKQAAPGKQWSRIRQITDCGSYSAAMEDNLGFDAISDLNYVGENFYITIGNGYPV